MTAPDVAFGLGRHPQERVTGQVAHLPLGGTGLKVYLEQLLLRARTRYTASEDEKYGDEHADGGEEKDGGHRTRRLSRQYVPTRSEMISA
ncbi:MAG: hypothetical protein QOE45_2509 [Frankiaceae bacterium]|nr:hypothetical protein [Frankiaceae bacterium]